MNINRTIFPLIKLLFMLCGIYLLYALCRLGFIVFNTEHWPNLAWYNYFPFFYQSFRFDLSAILYSNILVIFYALLPNKYFTTQLNTKIFSCLFIISNFIPLLFEIADWQYFDFNLKRSTAEVFTFLTGQGEFKSLLKVFIIEYWYLFLLAILILFLLIYLNKIILKTIKIIPTTRINYWWQSLIFIFIISLSILGMRGGFQLRPLHVIDAIEVTEGTYTPIILNTPFSIIATVQDESMLPVDLIDKKTAFKIVKPVKQYSSGGNFRKKNVVLLILESFSAEFTSLNNESRFTPFLNDLMSKSINFTNTYSNSLVSAEGIPAITAGIPSWMDKPLLFSRYNTNEFNSIANLLKKEGYHTAFFHGAKNGSMNFDAFSKNIGYDYYFGKNEYNNDSDYDGNWGIYDEPFLSFFGKELYKMPEPFHATLFTLSAHHPYTLPEKFRYLDTLGDLPIHPTLRYTDIALEHFFKQVEQEPWFQNTIFIITADHCSPTSQNQQQLNSRFQIPFIIYDPEAAAQIHNTPTQQIDILPTLMDYLHFEHQFFSLGNSALNKEAVGKVVLYQNQTYTLLTAPENLVQNMTQLKNNKDTSHNVIYLKSLLQLYNKGMIQNKFQAKYFIKNNN